MYFPGLCPQKRAVPKRFGVRAAAAGCRFCGSSLLGVLPEASFRRRKAAASCRTPKATGVAWGKSKRDSSKMNERSGNVYENKGALWKNCERSWNVYEISRRCTKQCSQAFTLFG
jgi:hypothetical protein